MRIFTNITNKKEKLSYNRKHTGIKNCTAKKEQIGKLFSLITIQNYNPMVKKIKNLPTLMIYQIVQLSKNTLITLKIKMKTGFYQHCIIVVFFFIQIVH